MLSRHFRRHGLAVPEIIDDDLELGVYLQQDLGNETLFDRLRKLREEDGCFSGPAITMYEQVLEDLLCFQIVAAADLDFEVCYPRSHFDAQSIRWDLNYFKYHFLKLVPISFDEQALEDDFERFTNYLLNTDPRFFLYRDFQSRNIMWHRGMPHYIDYQGGRRGALQYDVASLLQDAKADMPWETRDELLNHYIEKLAQYPQVNKDTFLDYYYGYALIRLMQALGAYGYRGLYEGKSHFLTSISHGVQNLAGLVERARLPMALPALERAWSDIVDHASLGKMGMVSSVPLTVHLWSFSYHQGLPRDATGNGGGFVFDCRILPNPGRLQEYINMTGKDLPVAKYLDGVEEVQVFLRDVTTMVDQAITHHIRRGFTDLSVAFGCTGGQHRSVYFAERIAEQLNGRSGVTVELIHREQDHL